MINSRTPSSKILVGIDARATEPGFKAHYGRGTGRYAAELLANLASLEMRENYSDLGFVPLDAAALKVSDFGSTVCQVLPFGRQTMATQLFLPQKIRSIGKEQELSLLHFLAHSDATPRCPVPYLVTVLDLIPLRFPELYAAKVGGLRFKFARYLEQESIRKALGIIAISEATKRDVVQLLGISEEKVRVTHLAAGDGFREGEALAEFERENLSKQVKGRLGIEVGRKLLLYVGGIDPRKNIVFLLKVLARIPKPIRPVLVLAGAIEKDDQFPILQRTIEQEGIRGDIVLTGYISDLELAELYRTATAFVFPSLYEGFGLPVLEAMGIGLPVIAGDNSAIPEVTGDASLLLPDGDSASWETAISRVVQESDMTAAMRKKGLERAKLFSWERTAEQTAEAYRFFASSLRNPDHISSSYAVNGDR